MTVIYWIAGGWIAVTVACWWWWIRHAAPSPEEEP